MDKTKIKILNSALDFFNKNGVADVSIRQIAKEAGISHSNLIYHYPTKGDIIQALHEQLLHQAIKINQGIDQEYFDVSALFKVTKLGFNSVYQFRFLFFDLLYICNTIPEMRKILTEVEHIRSEMYLKVINLSIRNNLMRKEEYPREYNQLINRIKIFSDHWISSSVIYEDLSVKDSINKYSTLFMSYFYPYLTQIGKIEFANQQLTKPKLH